MNYSIGDILALLGSLGLFLYGMKVMSDGLMKVAGDRMRNILASMTSNRVFGVMTGFIITAVIQSSSATTLMVVSFVNASLLTLTESVSVIMGANIGTTVTAWLINILGFKVKMSVIALPLVFGGFLMTFSKRENIKEWGNFVIGFSILFIGLQFLKEAVPDIKSNPEMLEFLTSYTNLGYGSILIFLLIGTLLTVILQSSSATMALTLIMCFEGWIPFELAAAMVLGENIGTTITANLAAFVANYNAKRTARAHLIFNMIGVIWMLILFFPFLNAVDWFLTRTGEASAFESAVAIPVALSTFHTAFNIINTFLLIWFVKLIVRIVKRLVKEKPDMEVAIAQPKYLSEDAINYPQTAIWALLQESKRLYENSIYKVVSHGLNVHRSDLESDSKLKKIISKSQDMSIDVEEMYYQDIKTIYGKIISYATRIQGKFKLGKKKLERVSNITQANRYMVEVVKDMQNIHNNLNRYNDSENKVIRGEYQQLQKIILRVLREINELEDEKNKEKKIKSLEKLRSKAFKSDVLLSGKVEKLIRDDLINDEMATSLINDSHSAIQICDRLIKAAELLYEHHDSIIKDAPKVAFEEEHLLEDPNDAKSIKKEKRNEDEKEKEKKDEKEKEKKDENEKEKKPDKGKKDSSKDKEDGQKEKKDDDKKKGKGK